jgi:D-sedoheptulose 7-phosphate isomerase
MSMDYLEQLIKRHPQLDSIKDDINKAYLIITDSFAKGGKLLIAGNGGSAADAEHIVAELMKSNVKKGKIDNKFISNINEIDTEIAKYLISNLQPGLPAIALTTHTSLITAIINDIDGNSIFSQQVYSYGKEGDVFWGISTSGNAKNVLYAAAAAKAKKLQVITLTGSSGGALTRFADVSIAAPETETYKVQELHTLIYHCLCLMIEEQTF